MGGRPKATAARGRLTLDEAAEVTGISKVTIWRRIDSGEVPAKREGDGSWSIARRDLKLIKPREPGQGDTAGRRSASVKPSAARYAAWEAAAGGKKMATWITEVCDRAAGYQGDED